jgi:hypothetical protein
MPEGLPSRKFGPMRRLRDTEGTLVRRLLHQARRLGHRIAELQFDDADGVPVIASLNVDQDGDLYELDVWKVDFKPVIRLSPPPLGNG